MSRTTLLAMPTVGGPSNSPGPTAIPLRNCWTVPFLMVDSVVAARVDARNPEGQDLAGLGLGDRAVDRVAVEVDGETVGADDQAVARAVGEIVGELDALRERLPAADGREAGVVVRRRRARPRERTGEPERGDRGSADES